MKTFFGITKLTQQDVDNAASKVIAVKVGSNIFRIGRKLVNGWFICSDVNNEIFDFPSFDSAKSFVGAVGHV